MYNFKDTVPSQQEDLALPSEAISIDGILLDLVISGYRTLWVSGRETLNMDYDTERISSIYKMTEHYQNVRVLEVGYQIIADSASELMSINNVLNGYLDFRDSRISFNDEMDKYFIGTKSTSSTPPKGVLSYTSSFEIVCVDPHKYATTETPFPATLNSDGVLEATIVNDGTAEVPISYEIKHKSDNGYVGIVSEYGAMEFGDKAEIDKVNNKMSEKVINFDYDQEPPGILLNEGVSCYPNYLDDPTMPNVKEGSFTFGKNQYGTTIALPNFGSSTAQYWHGPMMSFDIPPATSTGLRNGAFLFRSRFEFSTDVPKSGRTEFTLSNSGSRMFSFVFRDSESYSDSMVLEFHVKNTKLLEQSLDRRKFINGVYQIEIKKLGTTVNFKLARADQRKGDDVISSRVFEKSFNLSYLENIEVTQLSIWTVKYRNVPETSMGIVGTSFYWADLDNWVDLANRYSAGDVFYVDGISKQPYLNGVGALNDEIIGTNYFLAPPGETKVKFYFSDFGNELPDVKAIIRKGWL